VKYGHIIQSIIGAALHLDLEKVRIWSEFLAEKLEQEGEITTAKRLRNVLKGKDGAMVYPVHLSDPEAEAEQAKERELEDR
jgi:glucose-6-phosphate isomerase